MNFDPGGFVMHKLIDMMPDGLRKRLLQMEVLKSHASSLGTIPSQLQAIDTIEDAYARLGVRPSQRPLGFS